MTKRYLFYISQNYSFEILRPIQQLIKARGDECAWFVEGNQINTNYFQADEIQLNSVEEAINYSAQAVFVPGNIVPNFIPGLKVQVFHGLEWKKKGHFSIRGFFDLYCTHGKITTDKFNQLAQQHGHFTVKETGWPKLDPLFKMPPYDLKTDKPVILFAPTFSPNLTCALACYDEIKKLVNTQEHYWIVKFHPKMNPDWIGLYQKIKSDNFQIIETDSCLPLLQRADILISDTSSIIGEFLLLNKPAITYKNAAPGEYLIDIQQPEHLEKAIETALTNSDELIEKIAKANHSLHPYQDGNSALRVLQAVDELIKHPVKTRKKKPVNLIRKLKLRKRLSYWKW
ncbi:CDP-glycerol glycerophosphotransferase family protein [Aliikangiella sp. IMCC44359]|uniref:CDP-glycerol glycerophosphotransferase family protein n=1 Tax=Aliikangiella sp. IMCC44359 TaxID=3459125 RepID=UPI00403ABB41